MLSCRVIVQQVQTTSIIARERPRASTPNYPRSEQLPITASPQAPRRNLQQQGAIVVEKAKQTDTTQTSAKQHTHGHLQVQTTHQRPPQRQENFDFNPRQHETVSKSYVTPFDAHQGSEEVDLFGQRPFSSDHDNITKVSSQSNSHSPSPPVETDKFGAVPFAGGGPREMAPSRKNGPVPSKTLTNNKQLDPFGSEPFAGGQVIAHKPANTTTHRSTGSNKLNYGQEPLRSSPPTDEFGHAPFVVTENKLFRQNDTFYSPSSSASFSPTHQSISASCSEDLLISNRR